MVGGDLNPFVGQEDPFRHACNNWQHESLRVAAGNTNHCFAFLNHLNFDSIGRRCKTQKKT